MKPIWVASAAVVALCGSIFADGITSATGTFSAFPAGFSGSTPTWQGAQTPPGTTGSPFWNDPSDDPGAGGSHMMNVGYVLTGTGGMTGNVLGGDSVTEDLTSGGADPAAFSFVSIGLPDYLTLLFAQSSLDTGNPSQGTVFGYYVGSSFTQIYNVGDTTTPIDQTKFTPTTSGTSYGFYATVCYGAGVCETYTTGNGNTGNVPGPDGWNHFALFQLASGNYAIGFTAADQVVGEGLGDFNDVVVELQTVPEPGTIGIVAMGLVALGLAARARLT
jgi:hypothetical protein